MVLHNGTWVTVLGYYVSDYYYHCNTKTKCTEKNVAIMKRI